MWTHPELRGIQSDCSEKVEAMREADRLNAEARKRCYAALVRHFAPVGHGNGNR